MNNNKLIKYGIIAGVVIILFFIVNPFEYNDPTERTVVTGQSGKQFVQFAPGMFFPGFFAKTVEWPNQISVQYKDSLPGNNMVDNTMEIGQVSIRFNDATTAKITGITQYILPSTEKEMLEIHNAHKTAEALVKRRLAPYTQECLQSSAQLMSSEMHYSGGRAQMVQDYLDQLKNGAFLLKVSTVNTYDSMEKASKKVYEVVVKTNKDGMPMRKFSSIKEYAVNVGDAQITDVDYQSQVDNLLAQKIKAAADASISKQKLMTAQQQALTAKAEGEKKLVETEYLKKIEQTNQVVAAETKVKLQQQYKEEQKAAAEADIFASQKVKTDADAEAYAARQMVSAGLSPLDRATIDKETKIGVAEAMSKMKWPETYINGGTSGGNGLMENILSAMYLQQSKK